MAECGTVISVERGGVRLAHPARSDLPGVVHKIDVDVLVAAIPPSGDVALLRDGVFPTEPVALDAATEDHGTGTWRSENAFPASR